MSFRSALCGLAAAVCFASPVVVHAQGDYLEVLTVRVKPEKLADFQSSNKKFAEAQHRFNGERYLVLESVYGEGNVYQFTTTRSDYADIDKVNEAGAAALNKAWGKDGAEKIEQDFQNSLVWSHAEFRRRRWDLSRKAPHDAEAYAKLIGESRLLRTTAVHIRPGRVPEFEELMKELKEAAEKNPDTAPVFVSQVIEGGTDAIFYVSTLRSSMAGFDHNPTAKEILGEDGFKKFQQANAEVIETTDSTLYRFNPELSNAPDEVAKVAIDFWRPKSAAKPKSTPAAASATPKGATKKQ